MVVLVFGASKPGFSTKGLHLLSCSEAGGKEVLSAGDELALGPAGRLPRIRSVHTGLSTHPSITDTGSGGDAQVHIFSLEAQGGTWLLESRKWNPGPLTPTRVFSALSEPPLSLGKFPPDGPASF